MSTLLELITVVTDALGRTDDKAVAWATRGINYAQVMAAIAFNPPELYVSGALTLNANGVSVSLSTLTDLRFITSMYNTTISSPMYELPEDKWYLLKPSGSGSARYYLRQNATLLLAPSPTVENILTCNYKRYPALLTNDSDVLSFSQHDAYITTTAIQLAWAYQEEGESSSLFQKISDAVGAISLADTKLRKDLEEGIKRVENSTTGDKAADIYRVS